jgi:hypothetical protein
MESGVCSTRVQFSLYNLQKLQSFPYFGTNASNLQLFRPKQVDKASMVKHTIKRLVKFSCELQENLT